MKGDFSRFTFKRQKQFTRVLKQQGRVELDADWNENEAIQAYLREQSLADLIGPVGAPGNGFLIQPAADHVTLQILKGFIYVDGLLVENENPVTFTGQPYGALETITVPAVDAPALVLQDTRAPLDGERLRTDLLYLDVWEQHITAIEDSDLLEIALNGPDTATRLKTMWRVRWLPVSPEVLDCGSAIPDFPPDALGTGTLTTSVNNGAPPPDPCIVEPDAGGYRGLENRLYRVEIHEEGTQVARGTRVARGTARFKWSLDNGAVLYAVDQVRDANRVRLKREGRDRVLRLSKGEAVEIYSREDMEQGRAGLLTTIDGDPNDLEIRLSANISDYQNQALHSQVYLRRWNEVDQPLNVARALGDSGITVSFSPGTYRVGDYWTFPARARGSFETMTNAAPHGVIHHFAKLGLVHWRRVIVNGVPEVHATVEDCRPVFPPLTKLLNLLYVSGDGQNVLADGSVPQPLVVRVNNGGIPVANAAVRFKSPHGVLNPDEAGSSVTEKEKEKENLIVFTNAEGLAGCLWKELPNDPANNTYEVVAELVEDPRLLVRFKASFMLARDVIYKPGKNCDLKATTVQGALDELCDTERGIRITGIYWERALPDPPLPPDGDIPLLSLFDIDVIPDKVIGLIAKTLYMNMDEDILDFDIVMKVLIDFGTNTPDMDYIKASQATRNRVVFTTQRREPSVRSDLAPIRLPREVLRRQPNFEKVPVYNNLRISLETFAGGFFIETDMQLAPDSVSRATFYLTAEVPLGQTPLDFGSYQPLVLRAETRFPLVDDKIIHWQPSRRATVPLLAKAISQAQTLKDEMNGAILVRLMLKGNFIRSVEPGFYLDGEAFGVQNGSVKHNLVETQETKTDYYYSGNERRGGDFEMWFWVENTAPLPDQDDIGFVLASPLEFDQFTPVLSYLIPRARILEEGQLPPDYRINENTVFDPDKALDLLRSLGRDTFPLNEMAGNVMIPRIAVVASLENVFIRSVQPEWASLPGADNLEYDAIPDENYVLQVVRRIQRQGQPYIILFCRRSHFMSIIASQANRAFYAPNAFEAL